MQNDPLCQDIDSIKEIEQKIEDEINEALNFAFDSPPTHERELLTDVI